MKVVFFLFFSTIATAAIAQMPDAETNRLYEKNKALLQKITVLKPALQLMPDAVIVPNVKVLRLDNMPCVIPDTQHIVAIPNALPEYQIPNVAAIPNAVPKKDMGILKSLETPLNK